MIPENLFSLDRAEYSDLNWAPLGIRYRLDVCSLKLGLASWQGLSFTDRVLLLGIPFGLTSENCAQVKQVIDFFRLQRRSFCPLKF